MFVPVYPTTTEEEVDLLLRHSESRFVFAGDVMQFQKAFSILNKVKSPLKKLIVNYHVDTGNPNVLSYDELIRLGRRSGRIHDAARMIRTSTVRISLRSSIHPAPPASRRERCSLTAISSPSEDCSSFSG